MKTALPLNEAESLNALRESEERFAGAFEYAPIGMALVSPDGRWLKVNRALCDLLGYSEAEFLGSSFQNITHAEDLELSMENVRRAIAGELRSFQIEKRYYHKRGHIVTVALSISLVRDVQGQPRYFVSQIQDISERKRAETALRESEGRYRVLIDWSPTPVAVSRGGKLLFLNPAALKMMGATSEQDLVGKSLLDFVHPDFRQIVMDRIKSQTSLGGVLPVLKERFIRLDGTIIDVENQGRSISYNGEPATFSSMRDVTESARTEEELRESHEKFRQLADNITDAFWIRSPDLLELHYVSPAFERIWGRSLECLYANPEKWVEFVMPDDRVRVSSAFASLTGDTRSFDIDYRILRPDGELRWVRVRGFQVRDAADVLVRLIGIVTDITERKRQEAELEAVNKKLVETSRRAGMAEVATGILHNVGNVLNSVTVASSCVADRLGKSKVANLSKVVALLREHEADLPAFLAIDPKGRQLPQYLAQLAQHLAGEQADALKELAQLQKNIEHIKDIVTIQQRVAKTAGVTEFINVAELVEDALRMDLVAPAGLDLQVIKEFADTPLVIGEKSKVLQILVNLVRNARHACEASDVQEKKLTIRTMNRDGSVRIAVCDNGVGIPPENLDRIFTHGFTTKKDGHGFGLHGAAAAAREMGGSLNVHSDGLGEGAVFTLELPCTRSESQDE